MATNFKPLVSVIMPIFNRKKDLSLAIESILNQTVQDLELIIVDDGSTDGSTQVAEEYSKKDQRIILHSHTNNLGLATSLNHALRYAQGYYIARMDQDDISLSHRLQKQIEYMDAHPDVGICGAHMETISASDSSGSLWRYPESHDAIHSRMLFTSSIAHPTVMMKREVLRANNLWYDARAPHAEDYDLWSRALPIVRFANVPEVLLLYRLHATNTGKVYGDARQSTRMMIYRRLLSQLGIDPSEAQLLIHEKIGLYQYQPDANFLIQARHWLEYLVLSNRRLGRIVPDVFDTEIGRRWTEICATTNVLPQETVLHVLQSPLRYRNVSGIRKILRILFFLFRKIIKL